ncbi:MAG: DUF2029 domain-containing protein [Anaerolineae bacterium]|nr:DUF2029 domain-containing protein [Anaerolineae bacterium]MCA9886895.1 DUF2029 domain-containing protein [Anaerolineae bacterium]MCA9893449.1 DUF2029 domain-containing protein [Anaerolineae bacterium]
MALDSTNSSEANQQSPISSNVQKRLLIAVVGFVGLLVLVIFVSQAQLFGWDFRNNLWGPAHLLSTGRSPYLIDQLFDNSNSIWLPQIVGAGLPLGFLPQVMATNLWFAINILAYGALAYLAMPKKRPAPIWLGISILLLAIFPSFIGHLALGQISIIIAALSIFASQLILSPKKLWFAALLITLAAAKPQLLLLVLPGIMIAIFRQYGWQAVIKFAVYGILWTALLTLPLWIGYPNWVEGFVIALGRNKQWAHPSTLQILRNVLGMAIGTITWGIFAATLMGILMKMWWDRPTAKSNVIWSLALTALVTPYVWTWDFVLVVPLIIWTIFASKTIWSRIIMALGTGISVIGMIAMRVSGINGDMFYWWIPWVIVISAVVAWQINKHVNVPSDLVDTV